MRIFVAIILITLGFVGPSVADEAVRVMSYNLRYASPKPPNSWPERRPLMRELLKESKPDIIGTQEGVYSQLKDIDADLKDFSWIGIGRDGGSRGEFMAVYYRTKRFEPLEFDHFWLSDTPEVVGSKTWGPTLPRMVTWVKFLDKKTEKQFYLFNTHFDHKVQIAREKSSELLRKRIAALDPAIPVVVTGDFNAAAPTNPAYKILVDDKFLQDTWYTARKNASSITGTFNGFEKLQPTGGRIDWILTRGDVSVFYTDILTFSKKGKFPSDHNAVIADLRFGGE